MSNPRFFKGIAFLFPDLVPPEEGLDVSVTELNEFPCHTGTGMLLVSRSVCDDGPLLRDGEFEFVCFEDGVGVMKDGTGDPVFVPLTPHIHNENRLFSVHLLFQFLHRYSRNLLFHAGLLCQLSRASSRYLPLNMLQEIKPRATSALQRVNDGPQKRGQVVGNTRGDDVPVNDHLLVTIETPGVNNIILYGEETGHLLPPDDLGRR